MPNLNLKGDEPDEITELPEGPESDQSGSGSGGSLKRTLPLIAGGAIALVLAFYILNKIGIVHLWGNKKASSTVVISESTDSTSQMLSDSAMAEQFRKDSLEAVGAVAASKPHRDNGSTSAPAKEKKPTAAEQKKQAAEAKKAADAEAKKIEAAKKAEAKKLADAAALEKKAEAKKLADAKKAAADAEARKKMEAKKAAAVEQRNMTTVEVPGVPRRQTTPVQTEQAEDIQPRAAEAVKEKAPVKPAVREAKIAARPAEERVVRKPSETARKAKAPEPSSADASQTKDAGKYSVQLSSWTSASKARQFASRFTEAGVASFVVQQGGIYRVCTGRFATASAATARAEELVPMLETKYDIIILK